MLLDDLRSIAKTVEAHLGAGTSAEGRAADEIERLQRRAAMLETIIREHVSPSNCGDEASRRLVEEIIQRQGNAPALSQVAPPPTPAAPPDAASISAEPAPSKTVFEDIERRMASLLSRPRGRP